MIHKDNARLAFVFLFGEKVKSERKRGSRSPQLVVERVVGDVMEEEMERSSKNDITRTLTIFRSERSFVLHDVTSRQTNTRFWFVGLLLGQPPEVAVKKVNQLTTKRKFFFSKESQRNVAPL